ncbi:hypothetical protein [Flavobacterium daemonense]|uniref:hypothetical protein n=1 Tax=Flavobacterium daemonense TaxID=1393049 RepID=UPI0011848E98|nr:hypothetical protein [Flavobacterium daemonense]KAF2325784.1 hypothetical protein FND99_20115 [Flavobacterium daemonense]
MKIVQHSFGADLDWAATYAEQLGGKIVGNFIIVPEEIHTGVRYIADCGEDAIVLYINVKYNTDLQFVQKNLKDDFIGFYYDLTENKAENANHIFQGIERFGYNLSIIDGAFERTYKVKKGSSTFVICVFIKKLKIKQYAKKKYRFS